MNLHLSTNPWNIKTIEDAFSGADVLISASTPGPKCNKERMDKKNE